MVTAIKNIPPAHAFEIGGKFYLALNMKDVSVCQNVCYGASLETGSILELDPEVEVRQMKREYSSGLTGFIFEGTRV